MIRYFTFSAIFITRSVYFSKFYPWDGFPIDKTEWGAFGDLVGEVTNPILTFLTVVMLVKPISLQKEINDSITKQNSHMHKVSERQKEMDDSRSFESSFYSLAEISRREFDAPKIVGKNKKVYSAVDAVAYLEGYSLNACKSKTSKELTEQFSKPDTNSSMAISSAVRSFYTPSKFIGESCSDNHKEKYYEIANYIMSVKFLHLVCSAYVFGNWEITNDSKRYGFLKRKGLDEYVFNLTYAKDYY